MGHCLSGISPAAVHCIAVALQNSYHIQRTEHWHGKFWGVFLVPWGYISHSHADPSQKVILPLLCEGAGASSPPHLCCQVLEWVLQIPWGDIRWKKQREKLWHRIMKCNVRDAFFAQHWCLEAVHTVLEGRALGEGEWMATVWRMNGNCSVLRQRADCCWARTSHLTKLSACCKQPILGTGSVNTVRIDWMGSHGKSRAHLDCFREGMESVLQTSW